MDMYTYVVIHFSPFLSERAQYNQCNSRFRRVLIILRSSNFYHFFYQFHLINGYLMVLMRLRFSIWQFWLEVTFHVIWITIYLWHNIGSSPTVGSSKMNNFGSWMNATAIDTLLCSPPLQGNDFKQSNQWFWIANLLSVESIKNFWSRDSK